MMHRFIGVSAALAVLAFSVLGYTALAQTALDKVTDHGTTCTTMSVTGGTAISCSGKLSGLGSTTTVIEVTGAFFCTNNGGNNPPGQVSGQSGPIQPQNGQVTFTNVETAAASCPDHMAPTFGPTATINVFQNGVLVFTEQVAIT